MTAAGQPAATPPQLLFDQNLAPSLAQRLADLYPASAHVRDAGLAAADDEVIRTRLGNCSTADVERALRGRYAMVEAFAADSTEALAAVATVHVSPNERCS